MEARASTLVRPRIATNFRYEASANSHPSFAACVKR